eukprot:10682825-Alexandrium_andersonii.AAC.1
MSASLVGSEMCIRDRPTCATCGAVEGCHWCGEGKCVSSLGLTGLFDTCTAVSCPPGLPYAVPHKPVPEEWFLTEAEI